MNLKTFDNLFEPIKKKWELHFTPEVREQIYHIVKDVPHGEFKKLIGKMIWHTPYKPPGIEEFINFSRGYSPKIRVSGNFCGLCGYSGAVVALRLKDNHEVRLRCSCSDGKMLPSEVPFTEKSGPPIHWYSWEEVKDSGAYELIKPIDHRFRFLTDEERKENWKFLWDVLYGRVSKEETDQRLQIMERAIHFAQQRE